MSAFWHPISGDGTLTDVGGFSDAPPSWLVPVKHGWYWALVMNLYTMTNTAKTAAITYSLLCVLFVISMYLVPFLRSTALRVVLSLVILAGFLYELTVLDIMGKLPDYEITAMLLHNATFGVEGALIAFRTEIVRNVLLVLACAIPMLWKPPAAGKAPLLVIGLTAVLFAGVMYRTQGSMRYWPSPVLSYIAAVRTANIKTDYPLTAISYLGRITPKVENIIVVMDESVGGRYLTINGFEYDSTPALKRKESEIANFGVTAAFANCSLQSRLVFRHLLDPKDIDKDWNELRTRTTIWQYARQAGYATYHLDGFGGRNRFSHAMTMTEASHVDNRLTFEKAPRTDIDLHAARALREVLKKPGRKFIYVDKFGTHIPYNSVYPKDQNVFGAEEDEEFSLRNVDKTRKQYGNALRWATNTFFEILFEEPLPPSTLLVYTADHGQTFDGIRATHCRTLNVFRRDEGEVPLFAMSTDPLLFEQLRTAAAATRDHASNYWMRSTLLGAMGFDGDWARKAYGVGLTEATAKDARFVYVFGTPVNLDDVRLVK